MSLKRKLLYRQVDLTIQIGTVATRAQTVTVDGRATNLMNGDKLVVAETTSTFDVPRFGRAHVKQLVHFENIPGFAVAPPREVASRQ